MFIFSFSYFTYFSCFLSVFWTFYVVGCIGFPSSTFLSKVIAEEAFSALEAAKVANIFPYEDFGCNPKREPEGFVLFSEESFGSYLIIFVEFSDVVLKIFFC